MRRMTDTGFGEVAEADFVRLGIASQRHRAAAEWFEHPSTFCHIHATATLP